MKNLFNKFISNYSNLSKECWQSIFLTFVESSATGICFFLSLYFVSVLHMSIASAGFLISAYGVGTIFGGILGGKLSDYLSAKRVSVFSLLIQSIAFLLLTKLENEKILLLNMFIIGVCAYGFMTANNVWMLKQCQDKTEMRLKSINLTRVSSNLGIGVPGILIGIFDVNNFHALFYFSSLALLFSACYFQFFVTDNSKLLSSTQNISATLSDGQGQHKKKIIFLMLSCLFLIGFIISQLTVTYPIYIQQSYPHMGTQAVSILFMLDTLLIVLFQAPLVNGLSGFNKIFLVGIGAFLMGLGMFILNFSPIFHLAIVSCLIWTTGEMIFVGMAQFVCYESGAAKKKGQTMGVFQAVSAAGRVIGPVIGGYIYYYSGGYMLWSLSFAIGIVCFLLCFYFKKYDFINC